MPYGESMDFSSVTLPGVGGQINASNAITSEQLAKQNKTGRKWSPTKDGGMAMHNESLLDRNKQIRARRENLINRDYTDYASGSDAMREIMDRRKARVEAFQEIKRKEYNFADDTELLAIPQPFASAECSACKSGKCACSACKAKRKSDAEFREWNIAGRRKLKEGAIKGEFAGPDMSFPIAGPKDVSAAWSSVGRAENPRKVMAEIIRIAKKYDWVAGLPETVKQRLAAGESGLPSANYREWPTSKREQLQEGKIKGEFAGPGTSFPIAGPKDVAAAWSSVGRAANPRKVMMEIIKIAKRNGWTSGLPETVKQRLAAGESGLPE